MKNSVTTNYRRNSDNSSEQIQRIVIFGLVYLSHRFCGVSQKKAKVNKRLSWKEHRVNALTLGAEEGRDKLR